MDVLDLLRVKGANDPFPSSVLPRRRELRRQQKDNNARETLNEGRKARNPASLLRAARRKNRRQAKMRAGRECFCPLLFLATKSGQEK